MTTSSELRINWRSDSFGDARDKRIQNSDASVHTSLGDTVESVMEDSIEQSATFVIGFDELLFEPVAQGHQFIYFCHQAQSFGERWQGNLNRFKI